MTTTEFYNINSSQLINRYDSANMSFLYHLILKYIPKRSSIFDIGFGSTRDLQFCFNNGYDIWGVDPSYRFVENAKKRFPSKKNQFFEIALPYDKKIFSLNIKFDAVITIATWMHLQYKEYEDAIENIVNLLKGFSTVIISYSTGIRANDERYFEDVDLDYMTDLFKNKNFILTETVKSEDSLNRDNLTWITVIYKHD